MTDSSDIMNSVSEWLNIIEMKKFVDDGMFLQMKIILTTCQNRNTSTTRTNGGFIQISKVQIPCLWENVLISSKRGLPWNVYTKKLEKNHSCPLIPTSTNNGSQHRVRPLHGGNGKTPGLSRIHSILLQIDRLQPTAVFCNRRRVQGQHLKGHVFAMCNMQELWLQSELTMTRQSRTTTSRRKLGIAYAWWSRTMRRPTPMTTWKTRSTQSTWNLTRDVTNTWMCT